MAFLLSVPVLSPKVVMTTCRPRVEVVPETLCMTCLHRCGIIVNAAYLQKFMVAWVDSLPLPVCDFYKEENYHGLEGVRP